MNEEIQHIALYNRRHLALYGHVLPFVILYAAWLYVWVFVYGVDEYFEAGIIALVIICLLQILCCLFGFWFVQVQCLLTCSKVGVETQLLKIGIILLPDSLAADV